jgi:hypothetical protein
MLRPVPLLGSIFFTRFWWSVPFLHDGTIAARKRLNSQASEQHVPKNAKKRKYSRSSRSDVGSEMRRYKKGTAKSGPKKRKVKSRKQAIAIGLSKARKKGKKIPKKK